ARRPAAPRRSPTTASARAHACTGTSGSDRSTCTPVRSDQPWSGTAVCRSPDTVPKRRARTHPCRATSPYEPGPPQPSRTQDQARAPAPAPRPTTPQHSYLPDASYPESIPPTTDNPEPEGLSTASSSRPRPPQPPTDTRSTTRAKLPTGPRRSAG